MIENIIMTIFILVFLALGLAAVISILQATNILPSSSPESSENNTTILGNVRIKGHKHIKYNKLFFDGKSVSLNSLDKNVRIQFGDTVRECTVLHVINNELPFSVGTVRNYQKILNLVVNRNARDIVITANKIKEEKSVLKTPEIPDNTVLIRNEIIEKSTTRDDIVDFGDDSFVLSSAGRKKMFYYHHLNDEVYIDLAERKNNEPYITMSVMALLFDRKATVIDSFGLDEQIYIDILHYVHNGYSHLYVTKDGSVSVLHNVADVESAIALREEKEKFNNRISNYQDQWLKGFKQQKHHIEDRGKYVEPPDTKDVKFSERYTQTQRENPFSDSMNNAPKKDTLSRNINSISQWKDIRDEYKNSMLTFSSYETDPWLAISYPAFNDITVNEVSDMLRTMRACERMFTRMEIEELDNAISSNNHKKLPDASLLKEYTQKVDEFSIAVARAEKAARRISDSNMTEKEKSLITQIKGLLSHAEDPANTDNMRANYYAQLKKSIERLNADHTVIPIKIVAEIESEAQLLITDGYNDEYNVNNYITDKQYVR